MTGRAPCRSRRGLVLILTVGILVLLSFAAAAMVSIAARLHQTASLATDTVQARLLAWSGIGYGSARLLEDSTPRIPATSVNQADDWTCREEPAVPLEKIRNPSYAQTEPYADVDGNGRYDLGSDTYRDLDGNARFDAWSGRLRGVRGAWGGTFRLKVEGAGGKINVNEGFLGADDSNGNGIPDHRDLGRRMLLSGVCNSVNLSPRDMDPEGLENSYAYSRTLPYRGWLYHPLTASGDTRAGVTQQNRRLADCLTTLAAVIQGIDGKAYLADEVASGAQGVLPQGENLGDVVIRARPAGGYRTLDQLRAVFPAAVWARIRDDLVLFPSRRSIFSSTYCGYDGLSLCPVQRSLVNLGQASQDLLQALFQGIWLRDAGSPPLEPDATIQPDEARKFAAWLVEHRPFTNWADFQERIEKDRDSFFFRPTSDSRYRTDPVVANAVSYAHFDKSMVKRKAFHPYPPPAPAWYTTSPVYKLFVGAGGSDALLIQAQGGDESIPYGTFELDLWPEVVFSVESLGCLNAGSRSPAFFSAECGFRADHVVEISSQAGFEGTGGNPLQKGVRIGENRQQDRTQTYPFIHLESVPKLLDWGFQYSPCEGNVQLMDYSAGLYGDELFYVPFWSLEQPMRKESGVPDSFMGALQDVAHGAVARNYSGFIYSNPTSPPTTVGYPDVTDALGAHQYSGKAFHGIDAPPSPSWDPASVCLESVFRKDFAPDRMCASYGWDGPSGTATGSNHRRFVMEDDVGNVSRGTLMFWTLLPTITQEKPFFVQAGWNVSGIDVRMGGWGGTVRTAPAPLVWNGHQSAIRYAGGGWVHLTLVFDADQSRAQGYVDGTADPGLSWDYQRTAVNPAHASWLWMSGVDELRVLGQALTGPIPGIRGRQPRYWLEGSAPPGGETSKDGLDSVPSYTSPLYVFSGHARFSGAGWTGFVEAGLANHTRQWNQENPGHPRTPLRAQLWLYDNPEGEGVPMAVDLPSEATQWGGWRSLVNDTDPRIKRVLSARFKIWIDNYGDQGWTAKNMATLDQLSFTWKSGGAYQWISEK